MKFKIYLNKVYLFIKKNFKYIIYTVAIVLSFFLMSYIKKSYLDKLILSYKLKISQKKRDIEKLEDQKVILSLDVDQNNLKIEEINKEINEVYEGIQKCRESISKLELSKKLDKFDELGY